ncbi:hypothetical protein Enr10x_28820 [Gimesia panareensis]|uniref:Uncharacterized protein n=1 Tax=Gimesia panareensis TaxID=2527978 RepID=A0A517Q7F0_9PLAN|nr:hypothetical protein [Gimesia panareensis]QDT27564.1 hypothetical protein Enr10x_28820 [Gimesia panareensis]
MIVVCKVHGPQSGLMISPDLGVDASDPHVEIVDLLYVYDGVLAWEFHVSSEFAQAHGLMAGVEPLPDQPGEWARELRCCCVKCFEEAHGGQFDEDHKWVQE